MAQHNGGARSGRTLPVRRDLTVAYVLSALVAAGLAASSLAGLLLGQRGLYDPSPRTLPAFLGQDAISLLVGLPFLLASMLLARRGSLRGLLLWMGALFYVAYNYYFYVLGSRFGPLFPAHAAVVSMSLYALLWLLLGTDAEAVRARFAERTPSRLVGGFLVVMALMFASIWAAAIVGALTRGVAPSAVDRTVWSIDLTVLLPAMFWGGVWLWRRRALGFVAAGMLLVKVAFTGLTLVATTLLSTRWGVPADPLLPAYAAVGLGGLGFAALYLRCVVPGAPAASRGPEPVASLGGRAGDGPRRNEPAAVRER